MCSQPHCSSSKSSPGTALLPWAHQNVHPSRGHRQEKVSRLSPHLPAQRSVMNTSTEQLLRYPFPCLLPATGRFIIHHLLPVTPVSHWNCSSAGGRARSRREQEGTASNGQTENDSRFWGLSHPPAAPWKGFAGSGSDSRRKRGRQWGTARQVPRWNQGTAELGDRCPQQAPGAPQNHSPVMVRNVSSCFREQLSTPAQRAQLVFGVFYL